MISPLAPRILALPEPVRALLAAVDGPGWQIRPPWTLGAHLTVEPAAGCPDMRYLPAGSAWWPANPARAVAAVRGSTLACAYEHVLAALNESEDIECPNRPGDDHAAALVIIEAHVARSTP